MVIRPAIPADLPTVVRIHVQAFEGFFLTQLGPRFLQCYYQTLQTYRAGILLVAKRDPGEIAGFAAGFLNPPAFYAQLRARRPALAWAVLPRLLCRPSLGPQLLATARRVSVGSRPRAGAAESELASIAVAPRVQGCGLGKRLAEQFACRSEELGAAWVSLTTDAVANDAVNHFYQSLGYRISETFTAAGNRQMHRYQLSLRDEPEAARLASAA